MLTLLFLRKYFKRPLHFFGFFGFVLILAGGIVLGYFGISWALTGYMKVRPLVVLSMGAVIVGVQLFFFGLMAEMIINMAPKDSYIIREKIE